MQPQTIPFNPELLRWARNAAGLSLRDAVLRAKIAQPRQRKDEEHVTPEDCLSSWENGQSTPSLSQLKALAKAYRRPLVTFFLPAPPAQVVQLADYRTIANASDAPFNESVEFAALKRHIFQLHRELSAIARENQTDPLAIVGSCTIQMGVSTVTAVIRRALAIEIVAERRRSPYDAFRSLRDKAHAAGIYVVLMGNLGSHHSKVAPHEFRGIAIADKHAPLVVINSNDSKAAMHFTLAHELAHIFLGSSGVSNQNAFGSRLSSKPIEQFCNAAAAELVVPRQSLNQAWLSQNKELEDAVTSLADNFGVSEEVIARRLFDLALINKKDYGRLLAMYNARWKQAKKMNKNSTGGPNANALARYNFGAKTLEALARATDSGLITLQEAARTLNMSVARFEKVVG